MAILQLIDILVVTFFRAEVKGASFDLRLNREILRYIHSALGILDHLPGDRGARLIRSPVPRTGFW